MPNQPAQSESALPSHQLTGHDRHRLLVDWNDTRSEYPRDKCVHELFEAQAARTPDAVALISANQQLTYRELNERANQLAHQLRALGVGPEALVGLCLDRSLDLIVGILGILKAGGAYVPLDARYPTSRLAFMLQDAGVAVLVTHQERLARLPSGSHQAFCIDTDADVLLTRSCANVVSGVGADNVAYVMYTSGSTGQPKGVVVEHRAIARLVIGVEYATFGADRVFLQLASISFDASTFEIWGALLHGAQLVLAPDGVLDGQELEALLVARRVTTLWLTASLFNHLVEERPTALRQVDEILTGGEVLSVRHLGLAREHLGRGVRLVNGYGPTESTTFTCCYRIPAEIPESWRSIPIGRPIGNTQVYVLDPQGEPVTVGTAGELTIGGDGLARGYLNQAELTAERFVANPFDDDPQSRLYRTGDLCRWLPDGNLEFLGRVDDQVKLRGYRIELGEVQAVLDEHPAVAQSVVMLREDRPQDKRLVGYWVPVPGVPVPGVPVPGAELHAKELTAHAHERLPDFMVPSAFVCLESLPLTPNGKLDRRALPAPDYATAQRAQPYVAPRTPTERILAGIWGDVLGAERVGIHDNFIELGGHSILAALIAARASAAFQTRLSVGKLFESPTIGQFSHEINSAMGAATAPPRVALKRFDRDVINRIPLSFGQQRLWFLDQLEGELTAYNLPFAWRIRGPLDEKALACSLNAIVQRHEALRTTFPLVDGEPVQCIRAVEPIDLVIEDLSKTALGRQEQEISKRFFEESERPFDLATDVMLRSTLLRLAADDHVLLITLHHIAADAWSLNVFCRELASFYEAFRAGSDAEMSELPVQYADFAVWQREQLQGERRAKLTGYWRQQLAGVPTLKLPTDLPRPAQCSYRGAQHDFVLTPSLLRELKAISRSEQVTLHMALMATFQALLSRCGGQDDIAVGMPVAGRDDPELEGQIGFFVNTVVLRTDLSGEPTFRELLGRVRKVSLEAYDHQDLPFDTLVEELRPERCGKRNLLFNVLLQTLSCSDQNLRLPKLGVEFLPQQSQHVRFDLEVFFWHYPDHVEGSVVYRTDLFEAVTIERLAEQFVTLLEGLVAEPDRAVVEVPLSNTGLELPTLTASSKPDQRVRSIPREVSGQHTKANIPPRTPTERVLADIWCDVLGLDRVGIHDDFFELGGHSILAARVFARIEKKLGRPVPLALLFQSPTVEGLALAITAECSSNHVPVVVPLQTGGSRSPVILMPSMSGAPFVWKNLLACLDNQQPVFAIGLAGKGTPWSEQASLAEIASYYATTLRDAELGGPLHLLGYSFGGMLGYEIARQLQESDVSVGFVAVVDVGPRPLHNQAHETVLRDVPRFLANAPRWCAEFVFGTSLSHKTSEFRRKFIGWRHRLRAMTGAGTGAGTGPATPALEGAIDTRGVPREVRRQMEIGFNAVQSYVPGTYSGDMVVFRAKTRPLFSEFTPDLNWCRFVTGNVAVVDIPGNHDSILHRPSSNLIAVGLRAFLENGITNGLTPGGSSDRDRH